MTNLKTYWCVLLFFLFTKVFAVDTLRLTINNAEKLFLEKNLQLLSQKFFIEESQANTITARLWQNPGFHFEIGSFNPGTKIPAGQSRLGQQLVNVNQLILLAGKINKRVSLANINTQLAEYHFFDLLRTLRFTLRSAFSDLYYAQQSLKFYENEIPIIARTVNLYETQFKRGNISLKEVVRLKSLLFSLYTEKLHYINQVADNQQTLNLLLQTTQNSFILPVLQKTKLDSLNINVYNLEALLDSAKSKRYDLKIYQGQLEYARLDYKYQRALAVPDPTIGITYDRASNFANDYVGPSLDIPIPVLNRNRGNVQAAKIRIKENELQLSYYDKLVQEEIVKSYTTALETDKLFRTFDQNFAKDFDVLIDGVILNFEKKNISMIEFIDLYESYKMSTLQMYQLQNNRLNTIEDLNYRTGAELYKW